MKKSQKSPTKFPNYHLMLSEFAIRLECLAKSVRLHCQNWDTLIGDLRSQFEMDSKDKDLKQHSVEKLYKQYGSSYEAILKDIQKDIKVLCAFEGEFLTKIINPLDMILEHLPDAESFKKKVLQIQEKTAEHKTDLDKVIATVEHEKSLIQTFYDGQQKRFLPEQFKEAIKRSHQLVSRLEAIQLAAQSVPAPVDSQELGELFNPLSQSLQREATLMAEIQSKFNIKI